jgi:hypothetical protein
MNNDKQQTAVDFAFEKLANQGLVVTNYDYFVIFKQAKEMEKEQIKNAWVDGDYNTDDDGNPLENYSISDEHYYEQTYGGKDENTDTTTNDRTK